MRTVMNGKMQPVALIDDSGHVYDFKTHELLGWFDGTRTWEHPTHRLIGEGDLRESLIRWNDYLPR